MGRYLPGYRDGGPVRTIENLTEVLGNEYDFHIACMDRDHGDVVPYPNIKPGTWQQTGMAKVWYTAPGGFTSKQILKLSEGMDLIYLCSFYDNYGYRTLLLRRRGLLKIPVVLAAMGVFSEGAMAQKSWKKLLFLYGCRMTGLFHGITWSVSSMKEADDLKRCIGRKAEYVIAEDLPRNRIPGFSGSGAARRIVFLSRISPKKNLLGAIGILQEVKGRFTFDIYGPCEDRRYWEVCRHQLEKSEICWNYHGDVPAEKVQDVLAGYDIFLFPTLGENYGHVIFEALSVGCIPVISDRTPWMEISRDHAGYELPLKNTQLFSGKIDEILSMSPEDRKEMAEAGVRIAHACVEKNKRYTGYRKIFG